MGGAWNQRHTTQLPALLMERKHSTQLPAPLVGRAWNQNTPPSCRRRCPPGMKRRGTADLCSTRAGEQHISHGNRATRGAALGPTKPHAPVMPAVPTVEKLLPPLTPTNVSKRSSSPLRTKPGGGKGCWERWVIADQRKVSARRPAALCVAREAQISAHLCRCSHGTRTQLHLEAPLSEPSPTLSLPSSVCTPCQAVSAPAMPAACAAQHSMQPRHSHNSALAVAGALQPGKVEQLEGGPQRASGWRVGTLLPSRLCGMEARRTAAHQHHRLH